MVWQRLKERIPPLSKKVIDFYSTTAGPLPPWTLLKWTLRDGFHRLQGAKLGVQSAALTYSLILAFVPLLALGFTILKAVGGVEVFLEDTLDPLVRSHFGPVAGQELVRYLSSFVENMETRTLGVVALGTLFFTVVQLLVAAENAINAIAAPGFTRPWGTRFVSYWTLITLMPLLIVVSASKSRALMEMVGFSGPIFGPTATGWGRLLGLLLSVGVQCLGFSCVYKALIARSVPLRYILAGGAFASFMFEGLQHLNGFVIKEMLSSRLNKTVYGTVPLVAVIVFLWMRLVWVIVLVGAAMVASLGRASHFIQRIYGERQRKVLDALEEEG